MSDSATRSFWGQDGLCFIRIRVSYRRLHVAQLQRCHALDGVHGLLSLAQCLEHDRLSINACRMDDLRGSVQAEGIPSPVFIKRERSLENSSSLEFYQRARSCLAPVSRDGYGKTDKDGSQPRKVEWDSMNNKKIVVPPSDPKFTTV